MEEAGGLAAVDGAGESHHLLRRLGQVVHGVALVAVHPLILVHLIDDKQIQSAAAATAGPFLDVAGQGHFAVAEVVVGIERRQINWPAGGDGPACSPLPCRI